MNVIIKNLMESWGVSSSDYAIYAQNIYTKNFPKNYKIFSGEDECRGLVLILDGALRAYIVSPNGKEINLFILQKNEFCILSASCMLKNICFDVNLEFMQTSSVAILPSKTFNLLSEKYPIAKQFQTDLVSERLSRVVFSLSSLAFDSLGDRILELLKTRLQDNHQGSKDSRILYITHEEIANALGSAREAVSRMLKELQKQGKLKTKRGIIELL
ncbi:Crp/Fnr family transcriptional regulator [Helicobacter sp. MIT 11-5569]|uniref:Crp/Fnr family transcriptional regulator n=1 Tax=Helicobacter sp. MIT 11-5569 TaxID=1548151 RepID=UPI0009E08154|nr:Crp/Fnr family transcriptional regulator [Helicobacter sp. MIT 11-5569]TLD82652.1 Crp/Fnr family transcriptional regulator [Helicobacter sp. MIT 11-5569]